VTSPATSASDTAAPPDYAPIPRSALGQRPLGAARYLVVRHKDGTRETPTGRDVPMRPVEKQAVSDNSHREAGFQAAGANPAEVVSDVAHPAQSVMPT
jgi:hypothetical protein